MRLGLVLILCAGCHLIIDPDEYVSDAVDAATDGATDAGVDGGSDAGRDAAADAGDAGHDAGRDADGEDAGCGMLPMGTVGPPCCWVDEDCPTDGPTTLVCHGGMCGGPPGVCFPRTMSRTTGSTCFLDTDCDSGTCMDGPNCGCEVACESMAPMPGRCM